MAFVEYKGEILPYSFEDKAIDKVLELEGGYNPKDPVTGMPVNYGIDQRANPDVDVSKLTKEDAKKIYRDKYWKASGADELPEKLALVHFDAVVNQGPEKAKQLLESSGGDVNKYLELRKSDYQRLAEQNPQKYGSSLKGWMNRLDSIAADVTPQFQEYEGEILPVAKTKADIEKSREQGLKDIGKTIAAPIISGLASIPEATETMFRGATRNRFGPTGIILNKLLGAPVTPENVYPEAKIEALKDLSTKGEEVAEAIRESRSEETKKIIGESKIEGDLFDPSSWSIGEKPSTAGIAYQALEAISSTVPIIATALITKSPTVATGIGGTMGAGDAIRTTREYISKMSDTELAEKSPEFARLSEEVGPKKAREIILTKASEDASVAAGLIASIGGNITANLVTGKFDDLLLKSVKNRAGRIALGTAGGMTEEGLQELAEGIATDLGIDQYVARKIGTDSFANLVLGALGGAGPGGVRGAVAKPSEEKIPKGFEEVSPETEIVPVEIREAPVEVATPEEAAKFETAPAIEITGTAETAKAEEVPQPSQDVEYSLAELEGRLPAVEETVAEEPAQVAEEPVVAEEEVEVKPTDKAVSIKDMSPEDQKAIRSMEVEKNKIAREKKLFPDFLRRQGIQPSEKADLGLEGISRPGIFKLAAPTFDELTSRAISEGFLLSTGDDVQNVENFREYVRDYIGSGIISTGPDVAREAQIRSIDDTIQEIVRKYEKPAFGLEETTPEQLKAEADRKRAEEDAEIELEMAEKARQSKEEIKRRSEAAASEFELGKTAEEDLTGQKDIFAVSQREAEMQMDVDKFGKPKLEEALNNNDRIFIDTTDEAGKKTYYAKGIGSVARKYQVPLDLTSEESRAARLAEGDIELAETVEERDIAKKQLEDVLRPAAQRAISKDRKAATKIEEDPDADIPFFNIERKQTSTPAFKKWFGDSKVVNEDGSPMVVYHGTDKDFDTFKKTADIGFHFGTIEQANSRNIIDRFWSSARAKEGSNVLPVYIKLENPLRVKDLKEDWDLGLLREMVRIGVLSEEKMAELRKEGNENQNWKQLATRTLKDLGYDGLVYENVAEGRGDSYVVLNPNQIKSAIGNRGTFSADENNITLNLERLSSDPLFTQEQMDKKPSLRVELNRLVKDNRDGKVAPETFAMRVEQLVDSTKREPSGKPRERGQDIIIEKLRRAVRRGELSRESLDLAEWFIKKNPALVSDLAISIKEAKEDTGTSGYYNPLARMVTLIKGSNNNETAIHEFLHHAERMMPADIQKAIKKAWAGSLAKADKAAQKGKDKDLKKFYELLNDYYFKGDMGAIKEANKLLISGVVDYENYQHVSPSEFWAVNASDIMVRRFAATNSVVGKIKVWLAEFAETIKKIFGFTNQQPIIKALNRLAKSDGKFVSKDMLAQAVAYANIHRNYLGGQPPMASWDSPGESKMLGVNKTDLVYKLQDKFVDLKDVEKAIRDTSGEIDEKFDAYMKEELYHGRTAERIKDFLREDLLPIIKKLREKGLSIGQFEEYLHNRHAQERNEQIARVNEDMPDGGSGIMTADAQAYMAGLDPKQKATLESVAKDIDQMVKETQDILLDNGLEDAKTINTWRKTYKYYVPLLRDLDIAGSTVSLGGKGYGTRGKESKRATGSEKAVVDILANLAIQRERAIMKAEKARVGRALYGLALKNPNPGFWLPVNPDAIKDPKALAKELQSLGLNAEDSVNFIKEPVTKVVKDGVVTYAPNINQRFADNVFPIRVNGQDRFIFFNTKDPRAVRLITSLKNIDAQQLAGAIGMTAKVTRFIASMNTQYNPVFGAWNFTRDVGAAMLNLSTTPIADKKAQVLAGTFPALRAIYSDLRAERKEQTKSDREWGKLFEQFKRAGGQTGYRDQFSKTEKKGDVIQREMEYLDRGNVKKTVDAIAGWLSDYNDAMENAVRLSAFKAALDKGLSEEKAASIAKNLTVNFNRKGTFTTGIGALYAFFNASVQGTTRLVETLKGPAGKKIMAGGLLLGTFQALALAMYGFDDDEPPEFLKDKNLIIPTGDGKYLIIPMPLGFNAIPATGRRITEMVLSGGKDAPGKIIDLFGVWVDSFNPIGNGSFAQMLTPTAADPFVSVSMNKDSFGRPIYKEDRGTSPTPGFMRSSDKSSEISKYIAEFLNDVSSPLESKYVKGRVSPTADELDYIAGQYLGGVGREAQKAFEAGKALVTGDEIEPSRKPIVGKILGDKESNQAVRSKFYKNVTEMANHEAEIKGRKNAKDDTVEEYKEENPESRLWKRANDVENRISEINQKITKFKAKKEDEEYYKERVKDLEDRKIEIMRNFNERVKEEKESQ